MTESRLIVLTALILAQALGACQAPAPAGSKFGQGRAEPAGPMRRVDHLIEKGEAHFKHLWQVTSGGENTRPRWSPDGDQIAYQFSNLALGIECDLVRVQDLDTGRLDRVSSGNGVSNVGGYLKGGRQVIFASTHAIQSDCPAPPDQALGHVRSLDPAYDLYVVDLDSHDSRVVVDDAGHDAQASVSPGGDRIVFCSLRSGDAELWSCDSNGGELRQLTRSPGHEADPQWSADGSRIVFAATDFDPLREDAHLGKYRDQLARWSAAPGSMKIEVMAADGAERRTVTAPGKANWDPCFTPDGQRIVFVSNHHGEGQHPTSYDLFLVDLDGSNLERVTYFDEGIGRQFDGFPSFSADGRYLAFSSNRGAGQIGETNVFVAEWR